MASIFTTDIKAYYASNVLKALHVAEPNLWTTSTTYAIGDLVYYGNSKYAATTAGISGASAPTHTSGIASDGTVSWLFIENLIANDTFLGNLYFFIGKPTEWTNEASPDTPKNSDIALYQELDDLITVKRIDHTEMKIGVKRYNWTTGTVYASYNSSLKPVVDVLDNTAYSAPFYVLTDEYNVYKCLDNNNGSTSTIKPTGISTGVTSLADGYVWKYMGTLTTQDASDYLTADFFPVEYKKINDASNQWNVQQAAKPRSISSFNIVKQAGTFSTPITNITGVGTGASANAIKNVSNGIRQIIISDCGQNYTAETYAIVSETGVSGLGATATATLTNGVITHITLDTVGSNYTSGAIVLVYGDGSNANITATIAGDNSVQQLNIVAGGTGYTFVKLFIIPGTAGAVGKAVLSPTLGHGNNIVTELGASGIIFGIRLQTNDYFITGATSDFRQVGIISNLKDVNNLIATQSFYTCPAHPNYSNVGLHRIKPNTGNILYLNNINKVERNAGQEEFFRIVFGL